MAALVLDCIICKYSFNEFCMFLEYKLILSCCILFVGFKDLTNVKITS